MVARRMMTPLAPEDAARLHMSARANPMVISALLTLDRPIGHDQLEARLEARLAAHRRFRQVIVSPRLGLGMPRWKDDATFDVRNHVHQIDASLMPGAPALDDLVSDVASIPLSRRRPMWRAHLIHGRHPAVALVVHHALADGAALLALLDELVDEGPSIGPADPVARAASRHGRPWQVAAGLLAAGRLAAARADPRTPLRGPMSGHKRLAFSSALALDELVETAHALGTTVTGVLLLAITGACRAEVTTPASDQGLVLHALVPLALNGANSGALGNHFGSALVPLPVGVDDLASRVDRVREATAALRMRGVAAGGARIAAAAGALTPFVERLGVSFFSRKATVVASSVRGPTSRLRLCGATVRDLIVWAPAPGTIALAVTLMSYGGRVRVGVAADASVVGDARRVVSELEREIAAVSSFASRAGA